MLDERIVRVGIEIGGQIKIYEGLDIHASGTKYGSASQNECTVTIANIDKDTRDYILAETSPFNMNRVPKRLIVWAGRQSYGVSQLFVGDITHSGVSQPPDIAITLKALTCNFDKGNIVSRAGGEMMSLQAIASIAASDLGLTLEFQATNKNISNYSYTGSSVKQVWNLQQAGLVDAFIDDNRLVVKDRGKGLSGVTRVLNKDSGMIGIPEANEHGIKVVFLCDNQTQVGGMLSVESEMNPALNGSYIIYKLAFDIANRAEPFYYIAEGVRVR